MTNWDLPIQRWTGADPVFEKPNVARFETGEVVEYFSGRILIHRADEAAFINLLRRQSEESRQGSYWSRIFWNRDCKWSDGAQLELTEIRRLMGLVPHGVKMLGHEDEIGFWDEFR